LINIAVLGCGRIAQHHCDSIQTNKELSLVAVCDLKPELSRVTGEKYNVPWYANFSEMAKSVNFDTVAVITPSGAHFDHAHTILNDFGKNLIIEKPTFLRKSDFSKLVKSAASLDKNIFPIFQNRKNRAVERVAKGIKEGELGFLQSISVRVRWCREISYYNLAPWRGTFSMDGGALTNQGVHHLDLIRYLFGEPSTVYGQARTFGANIEVEDTFLGVCEFVDGECLASIEITTAARPRDFCAEISILGSKGVAQIGGIAVNELQIYTPDPASCKSFSEDFSECVYGNGHVELYSEIASHETKKLKNKIGYSISMDDAYRTISFLDACYRAIEQKRTVLVKTADESLKLGHENEFLSGLYKLT